MEVGLLGPVEVRAASRRLSLGGSKQRAVLAMLALRVNEVVSVERLVDGLWGQPPESAVNAVQVYVSRLRKALQVDRGESPPGMPRRGAGYLLELDADRVDLYRFERLVQEGLQMARADPERAAGRIREAADLWRGPALAEFADEPFAQVEMPRLDEMRLIALEARISAGPACCVGR